MKSASAIAIAALAALLALVGGAHALPTAQDVEGANWAVLIAGKC